MAPLLARLGLGRSGFGFGRKGLSFTGGFIVQVSPSISGQTTFNLNTENLVLDGGSGTSYTLTVAPSSTESTGTIQIDAWGEATASSPAGYAGGFISMTPSSTFAVRLNAGPGPGGSLSGSGISPRGGGYAGIFDNNTVNQANALIIAGGGGGGGAGGSGGNDNEVGSFFGSGGSKVANFGLGAYNNPQNSYGGRGGSHSAGGAGGSGGGSSGSALQGGTGGNALSANNASGGAGGGGGYYGGGGGAGGYDGGETSRTSASGGGGSSYVSPSVQKGQIHYYTSANQPLRGSAGEKTSSQSTYRNSKIIIKKSSTLPNVLNISYSGQNSVSTDGDWRIVRWTSPGSLTVADASPTASSSIDFLCIGGGGGGGTSRGGGGGGAGEFRQGSVVVSNGTFAVTAGSGGGSETQGGDTSISGLSNVFAAGGGRGGTSGSGSPSSGSGGGGGHGNGSGGPGQFNNGGSGYDGGSTSNGVFLGGGGGGADRTPNGTGKSAIASPPLSGPGPYGPGRGGDGGGGITSDLFGVSGCAGGGAGTQGSPGRESDGAGVGGSPGGGAGGRGRTGGEYTGNGSPASTFGSGGGGSGDPAPTGAGSGYPGIVYIRYRYQ
jgi:hypothetical protein